MQAPLGIEALGSSGSVAASSKQVSDSRMAMAKAALAEVRAGDVVNLGIGIPTLVADLIDQSHGVVLHSENGMLGVGPEPASGGALEHPVNAGKIPVTELPGSSYFDSSASFGMIRGGHVDVAIMGGLQVDQEGNLAIGARLFGYWRCDGSRRGYQKTRGYHDPSTKTVIPNA